MPAVAINVVLTSRMKLLKASVIIMGVLIVLGIIVLIAAVAMRGNTLMSAPEPVALNPSKAVIERLNLPEGSEVRQMISRADTIVLLVRIPDRGDWIYFLPLSKGGKLTAIAVTDKKTIPGAPTAPAKQD